METYKKIYTLKQQLASAHDAIGRIEFFLNGGIRKTEASHEGFIAMNDDRIEAAKDRLNELTADVLRISREIAALKLGNNTKEKK